MDSDLSLPAHLIVNQCPIETRRFQIFSDIPIQIAPASPPPKTRNAEYTSVRLALLKEE